MPRTRHANPSDKAKQSRIYRKNRKNEKRFEAPLKEFIEIKYKNIFEEYNELFNRMDAENPNKIDLRKTEMFKQWKAENKKEANTVDVLSLAIKETIEASENNIENSNNENNVDCENETTAGNQWASDNENETTASEDEASEGNYWGQDEGMLAAQRVDELVNQMIMDDEIRQILNTEPEKDEGIELNIEEELELDIEDFDYRLEVELNNW